jgi:hypothetical protein
MKTCPECGESRPHSDFGRNKTRPDGLSFYCLPCNRARNGQWYREHRRRQGKVVRDHSWVPDGFRWCPECKRAVAHDDYSRSSRTPSGFGSRCKACHNAANNAAYWMRTYGLTKADVAVLRASQGDCCGVCGAPAPQHLDHDHETGRIRKLLCQRCNHGLGLFRDDPYLLRVAALYVEGHREQDAFDSLVEIASSEPTLGNRPGSPPVGSQRRPGSHGTTTRSTGRNSGSHRRDRAREADE